MKDVCRCALVAGRPMCASSWSWGAVALLSLTPEETVRIMEQDVPR